MPKTRENSKIKSQHSRAGSDGKQKKTKSQTAFLKTVLQVSCIIWYRSNKTLQLKMRYNKLGQTKIPLHHRRHNQFSSQRLVKLICHLHHQRHNQFCSRQSIMFSKLLWQTQQNLSHFYVRTTMKVILRWKNTWFRKQWERAWMTEETILTLHIQLPLLRPHFAKHINHYVSAFNR